MIDRGADIGFLSQYPHEKEILFAPLTGIEVQAKRIEGAVLVVAVRLSVNLTAQTIEQVVGKRKKMLADMLTKPLPGPALYTMLTSITRLEMGGATSGLVVTPDDDVKEDSTEKKNPF